MPCDAQPLKFPASNPPFVNTFATGVGCAVGVGVGAGVAVAAGVAVGPGKGVDVAAGVAAGVAVGGPLVGSGVAVATTPAWLLATRSSTENVNTPLLKFSTKRRALLPDATKLSESCAH